MSKDKLYSDQEISAILKRAGEMQATQSPEETHGLSLDELQQIAREVGLDPSIVAAAAAELEHAGLSSKSTGLLGAPTSIHIERVIQGEIDDALMPEVAAKIGEAFGLVGRSGQVGRSLEWTHSTERTNMQVTVMPQNGQTKVRVIGKYPKVALGYFLPLLMIGGMWSWVIPLGVGAPAWVAFVTGFLGLALAYMASRFGFSRFVRKKERAAEKLLRELEGMAEAVTPAAEQTSSRPRLNTDLPITETEDAQHPIQKKNAQRSNT